MKAGSGRAAALLALAVWGSAEASGPIPPGPPEALVDLTTRAGTALVSGTWRYSDTKIFEVDSRGPGPDLKPSGPPNRTYDYAPRAGGAGFDDSAWTVLEPESLQARRSTGRLSFNWYRINVTIPERVAGFVTAGSTVVFEVVVDDYSEVWVDGRLPRVLGQSGGGLAGGFNAPNRVVLTHDAQPGRRFQIAVFGINGPISDPPSNFIWVRSATLEFHRKNPPGRGREVPVEIVRLDPEMDRIATAGTPLYRIAEGFTFIEGPVWHPDGYLLFSSPNSNVIHRWSP
ncbi:MAG TPA: SMP-30/gluconolactonase/LRE family protein, partial [Candidatus Polarisedimenticolia bacterium]|nr:SMP-30/gluconolactonase/LRE family protein [Candidatus Polarisedimenticolia bacterium]